MSPISTKSAVTGVLLITFLARTGDHQIGMSQR